MASTEFHFTYKVYHNSSTKKSALCIYCLHCRCRYSRWWRR